MAPITTLRSWHRRLSALVGVQLLLWTLSGLIFTWDPIEVVRSEGSLAPPTNAPLPDLATLTPLGEALARATPDPSDPGPAAISLSHRRQRWVWEFSGGEGQPTLVDAFSGELLPAVDAEEALRLAEERFLPEHDGATVTAVEEPTSEFRGELPAWRVAFDDDEHTAVYVDGISGELTKLRSDTWRRFDFFWMLHIMDYSDREDFNTPWLKIFAALGLTTSASGLGLGLAMLIARRKNRGG